MKKISILAPCSAKTKPTAIKYLLSEMVKNHDLKHESSILTKLNKTDKNIEAAVGNGLVVSHAVVSGITKPIIGLAVHEDGFTCKASDGVTIKLLYLVLGSEKYIDDYLRVLAKGIFLLTKPQVMSDIVLQETDDDIQNYIMNLEITEESGVNETLLALITYQEICKEMEILSDAGILLSKEQKYYDSKLHDKLNRKLKKYEKKISLRLLERFRTIDERYKGNAIVRVINNSCSGCNTYMPSYYETSVRNNSNIVFCSSCGRILY